MKSINFLQNIIHPTNIVIKNQDISNILEAPFLCLFTLLFKDGNCLTFNTKI